MLLGKLPPFLAALSTQAPTYSRIQSRYFFSPVNRYAVIARFVVSMFCGWSPLRLTA